MMANATIAEWRDRALRAEAALEAMQANWADAKEKSKQAVERARTSQREAEERSVSLADFTIWLRRVNVHLTAASYAAEHDDAAALGCALDSLNAEVAAAAVVNKIDLGGN